MISIDELSHAFGKKQVLQTGSLQFETAKVHGIIGLNGAGKTTFFNVLAGFLKPATGAIGLNGSPANRSDFGYAETSNFFYSNITGLEYLDIFPASNRQFDLVKLNQLLQIPLQDLIENYSTGMKKKLALLAVLKQDKPVYIFDEPFNGLDLESNKVLELIIGNLKEKGKIVFVSSHVLSPLFTLCDQIHLLQLGRFTRTYDPAEFTGIDTDLYTDFNRKAAAVLAHAF